MNRRLNKAQRNYIIMGLCAILVIMGVGYAAFQSQLKISGTSSVSSNFAVKITDITVATQSGGAADKPEVTTHSDTTATFGVTLQSPGDSITYDIRIENQGTIDAILKTITKTDTNNSAILFETSGVAEGDALNVGESKVMKVTVTYNPAVTSQPTDLESTLNLTFDYEQADGIEITPPIPSGQTPNDLKALAVTEGDGLYADEYESGRYFYKGANPNNYITFNNETWRIISIESDGSLKIMRNESIGERAFDTTGGTSGSNQWDRPADIKTYLNGEYLSTITTNQDKIVPHTWSMGGVTSDNSDLADQINGENSVQSQTASVGLITASEYLRANTNTEQCGNFSLNNSNYLTCNTTDWMYKSYAYWWTISPYASYNPFGFLISTTGGVSPRVANYSGDVFPVLYLSSDITLIGDGTSSNPFTLS